MTLLVHSWGKFNLEKQSKYSFFSKASILNFYFGYQNKQKSTNKVSLEHLDFPCGSDSKEFACNAGDSGLILGLAKSLREGNGSSILAWRIPWTEEPGGLQSTESQKVRHD